VEPDFLQVADILMLHEDQLDLYGGERGVRDMNLLESAVAQARATFGGEFLHRGIFDMATAYLFHIVQNHPFLDGNKRTGLVAALVFLELNGIELQAPVGSLYELTIRVATGRAGKPEIAEFLQSHAHPTTAA
jgi:death-on-curing protein